MTADSALPAVSDAWWRLAPALLVLALLLLGEWRWPWRAAAPRRWLPNLGLGALSFASLLLLPWASMTAAAHLAAAQGFGLLHWLAVPLWLALPLSLLALDLALYAQHRALHWGPLWRLHRVHHLDPMLDLTTGLRFHPFEAIASAFYKSLVVWLLGVPVLAAGLSGLLNLMASLFTHANLRLPAAAEQRLRWLLVTPALHRIHHSTLPAETGSNFGALLWVWDRLFGSARASAARGEALVLGVDRHQPQIALTALLGEPFAPQPPPDQVQ